MGQVAVWNGFPHVFEIFGHAATAFRETGIAYFVMCHQHFAKGGFDCCMGFVADNFGDSLVTLAVVVGTYVEQVVVFASYNFV